VTDPDVVWWYRTPSGDLYGPYGLDLLRRFATEGRIDARGSLREGDAGDWRDPFEVLASIGVELGRAADAPPVTRMPPVPGAGNAPSSVTQTTYILLGLLPFLLVSIGGIHNLTAGRIGSGVTQLILSLVGIWGFGCVGAFSGGLGFCVALPIWAALLVWVIVDVATVRTDGAGRPFRV
jgi:hypothetical protein